MVGKKRMLLMKYSHAHRKPCQGPNACLVQTYSPPSSGKRAESDETTRTDGRKKAPVARSHMVIEPGPACAAAANHRTAATAEMLKKTRCHTRSSRRNAGALEVMADYGICPERRIANDPALPMAEARLFRAADLSHVGFRKVLGIASRGR